MASAIERGECGDGQSATLDKSGKGTSLDATTGAPHASASNIGKPNPSHNDGKQNAAHARNNAGTSARGTKPNCLTARNDGSISGHGAMPPATTKGGASGNNSNARNKFGRFFFGSKLPR